MRMNALLFLLLFAPATERLEGVETVHGMLDNGRGSRVQTILTRPRGAAKRLPAVLLIPWLSCDAVELTPDSSGGMEEMIRRIATRANVVFLRVEKPGLGASEGPPCRDLDFQTELAGYRAGLQHLRAHPSVDPGRIVLLGMSNGGGILPLVAQDVPVAGYVVINGWSRTWFEHMMEMLRRNPEMRGTPPGEVSARIGASAELYADYLLEKKLPGDIVKAKPHLAAAWDDEPAHQYGRPARFFHQLQELNLAAAWSNVTAPTLVLWGEYDWIMGREDHERIVAMVNRNRAGAARLVVLPKTSHGLRRYDSFEKSIREPATGRFAEDAFAEVQQFLGALKAK